MRRFESEAFAETLIEAVHGEGDFVRGSLTPLGRLRQTKIIADIVTFLAGDDARWVS